MSSLDKRLEKLEKQAGAEPPCVELRWPWDPEPADDEPGIRCIRLRWPQRDLSDDDDDEG